MTAPEPRPIPLTDATDMQRPRSRWTLPLLRTSMAVFLATWGLDKLLAVEGSQRIFERFYGVTAAPSLIQIAGVAELALAALLAAGVLRRPVAWTVLLVNAVSTLASWRQILDPWGRLGLGPGGTHLFLASIVIMAVSVALVLEAEAARRGAGVNPDEVQTRAAQPR